MAARVRYDQRVLALIEVRGGSRDWAEAESVFEAHGWPVVGHEPRGQGASAGILSADAAARVYRVEIRLYGAARRAERGATWQVRNAARAAQLEMYVRRADRLDRDSEMLTEWLAYSTAHRAGRLARVARRLARMGVFDAGTQVTGGPGEAFRLARAGLDGGSPRAVAVRPMDGRWKRPARMRRERQFDRRMAVFSIGTLVLVSSAAISAGQNGGSRYFWVAVALVAGCGALSAGGTVDLGRRWLNTAMAAGIIAMALLFTLGEEGGLTETGGVRLLYGLTLLTGLWLLVRQWTWGEWATWAVPLTATLLISSLVGAGSVLHALYADSLQLTPGDLDVPPMWQFLSALRLVTLLMPVLLVPAVWGIAKHYHYVVPGERVGGLMYVTILAAFLVAGGSLAMDSAEEAASLTEKAARQGHEAPHYYGVEPAWTCVEPTVPLASLPGEGPRFDPARPYLAFGVAGGDAVLWDRRAGEPLKVPAGKVRLVPAKSAQVRCGR
ncbi:hypothetical protein [Streptomyces liangshanensis]|uniref:NnrS multi-domain protein n=1 Tax=Streptomyces liangshanensis TaxID=2717324 RepID=A0A6G9GWH2_9ACTN|nr:hypothetical protein [Streptomyces liangshanensis]QIQ02622.1 hypothetical protein HA039_10090 [Streptomyces liangshanensis]